MDKLLSRIRYRGSEANSEHFLVTKCIFFLYYESLNSRSTKSEARLQIKTKDIVGSCAPSYV